MHVGIDDGRVSTVVLSCEPEGLVVRVWREPHCCSRLRAGVVDAPVVRFDDLSDSDQELREVKSVGCC